MISADWGRIRSEFPALANWTFLNTATFGQLPIRATEAVRRHFAHRDELACHDFLGWYDDMDRLRVALARLIHCGPEDIAFIPNAAFALSLLLGGIDWRPGDRIVTLAAEFPNNLYSPALTERHGVEFVEASWDNFAQSVDERTRIVVISTVNYATGFRPPLAEISRLARERGALLYLDGTQSIGALEFDCGVTAPDMLAVHAYKWMLAPNGAGFMYVKPSVREWLRPNVVGWRSDRAWREVDSLHHGTPRPKDSAEKYEGGALSTAVLYALEASLGLMLDIGPALIEQRVQDLAGQVRTVLRGLGAKLLSEGSPHFDAPIVAARFDGVDVSRLSRELKDRGVLVSARHGNLRVSTHFYNNEEDIETLGARLRELL